MSPPGCKGRKGEHVKLLLLLLLRAGPHLGEMPGPGHQPALHRKARKWQRKHRLWALLMLGGQVPVFIG